MNENNDIENASKLNAQLYVESSEQTLETTVKSQPDAQDCPNSALSSADLQTEPVCGETLSSGNSNGKKHAGAPLGNENHKTHGDYQRRRRLRERRRKAIRGNTVNGKAAQEWREWALSKKGGKSCTRDIKQKIQAGTFYLWRALELQDFIVADYRRRGTLLDKRKRTLPRVHEQYDSTMTCFLKISDQLALPDYSVDLFEGLKGTPL